MLHRFSRYYPTCHRLLSYSSSIHLRNKFLYSTSKKTVKGYETEYEKEPLCPQEEFAETWEVTTDDKIEHLTREVRKSAAKKTAIFGGLSAFLLGKMGWYQFQFLGMPAEMEVVMVHLPVAFLTIHWLSWYFRMNGIYSKIKHYLPSTWTANEGLIGGTNPDYHKLVVMDDKTNLALLDDWTKELNRHRILCASLFAANMTIIMLTGTINPFGDPSMDSLDPIMVGLYSLYPVIPYAFSCVVYASPMKNVPQWKQEIVEDLGMDQDDDTEE
eukprot:1076375_1